MKTGVRDQVTGGSSRPHDDSSWRDLIWTFKSSYETDLRLEHKLDKPCISHFTSHVSTQGRRLKKAAITTEAGREFLFSQGLAATPPVRGPATGHLEPGRAPAPSSVDCVQRHLCFLSLPLSFSAPCQIVSV